MYIKDKYKESLAECPLVENNQTVSGDWELRKRRWMLWDKRQKLVKNGMFAVVILRQFSNCDGCKGHSFAVFLRLKNGEKSEN